MGLLTPLVMALGLAAAPLQGVADPVGAAVAETPPVSMEVAANPAPAVAQSASDLPARTPPPRTLRDQWPVFVLFAVSWLGIVGYLVATGRKLSRLADDVAAREAGR